MHDFCFAARQSGLPAAASPEHAEMGFERWREAAAQSADPDIRSAAEAAAAEDPGRRLLSAVFGNSPFLTRCACADPGFACRLLGEGPDAAWRRVMADLGALAGRGLDDGGLARGLRIAKRRLALAVAVADISGAWPLDRVTAALSDFADAALGAAVAGLLRAAAAGGAFELPEVGDGQRDSGLVVLGMGKLGARELNYSSDVDLIVLYDAERIRSDSPDDLQMHFERLTRNLVRLLEERTAEGYVFRTDLRLRPDPGIMPLAISVAAAATYYEILGQNWERAAMIKARPVAGDREAGAAFLDGLRPYVWRKHLDFAAIQDIHSIKRQINAHRGGGRIALNGHNIKLGRGGIREIELFAQTQQLIWGGRQPKLRVAATSEALNALAAHGQIDAAAADELNGAYRFLRRVEHRLQMIDDEQTHTLPRDDDGLRRLAVFLGYPDGDSFASELLSHLRKVETHYAALFEDAPALSAHDAARGNLVFTGGEADPETIRTIERLGYRNPQAVDNAIRGWHHGRYRAMRSTRARELLTELIPVLLEAFAGAAEPEAAFLRFDEFLSRLPSGVQLFSLFNSNPHLLGLVAEIMGVAPRLAAHLSRETAVLDSVLSGDFFEPPPAPEELDEELDRQLTQADTLEDVLDIGRRWANDRKFQVGVQSLRGLIDPRGFSSALANIADTALGRMLPRVHMEFAERHGTIPESAMAIVAMGNLGGAEMNPASDLDLIFVYATATPDDASDGPRPLPASQYFARLSQRLINALTARTAEGVLYEVDMRLRPSGHAGPIASSFESFVHYHDDAAWTWEHMALTRARTIAGPIDLRRSVEAVIHEVLTRPRDAERLLADVAEMRARMDAEHHSDSMWELKHLRGGLVDIEFLAQYLQLRHAHDHPRILSPNTRTALTNIRDAGLLEAADGGLLIEALDLWQAIHGMLALTIEGDMRGVREDGLPGALRETLARIAGAADFAALSGKIEATSRRVHERFVALIEAPAQALAEGHREKEITR